MVLHRVLLGGGKEDRRASRAAEDAQRIDTAWVDAIAQQQRASSEPQDPCCE